MELGNMVFGHSRGNFNIDRDAGWESELCALFHRIVPSGNDWVPEFENDVFCVRPYYWGDCSCGWDDFYGDRLDVWEKANPHKEGCYRTRVKNESLSRGWKEDRWGRLSGPHKEHTHNDAEQDGIRKRLCKEMGLTYPDGCAIHCTCGRNKEYDDYVFSLVKEFGGGEEGHKKDCPIVLPNFLHKPSGFEIRWYKYPLRDSYKNQDIGLNRFVEIIDDCIKSLPKSAGTNKRIWS